MNLNESFWQSSKKKKKRKLNHSSWTCVQALLQRWPPHTPCSHQHYVVDHSFLLAVSRVARAMSKTASRTGVRASSSSSSVTKRVTASRLEAIAGPWYFFSKLAARPSLKTPACRLLDVTVARRTCASKNIGKERGSPQVKSMLKALGKTDRCLVGVVLFARLECLHRNAPDPSRQRQGPRHPNRDVWVRTVRNVSPSVRETKWKFRSNIVSMEFAFFVSFFFFFFFFFFSFLHFLETGKVKPPPPPPNGHARILVNAEIYGRSLTSHLFVDILFEQRTRLNTLSISLVIHLHWTRKRYNVLQVADSLYFLSIQVDLCW